MDTAIAKQMLIGALDRHGLSDSWTFKWSTSHRVMGDVSFQKKEIRLSKPLMEVCNPDQVLDTINHELAHILVGPGMGHGPEWQKMAALLGARPEARASGIPNPPARYSAECSCGQTHQRNRLDRYPLLCSKTQERLVWNDRKTGHQWIKVGTLAESVVG